VSIGTKPAEEAHRLAEVLKRHPPPHFSTEGVRMQLYLRDLNEGGTTLIADEPFPGLAWASSPNWSNDGRRIAFHAAPSNNWQRAELMILEARDGKPSWRSLGPGCCPAYSPDDQRIAFLLWPGSVADPQGGVWLMNADGTERRRVAEGVGAPFWSPNGERLMLNNFAEPSKCRLLDLATGHLQTVLVPGHHLISWPSWVDRGLLVAVISLTGRNDEAIVLLDVSAPAEAKIARVLWKRGPELDVLPRWPLYRAATGQLFFVGVEGPNMAPGDPTGLRNLYEFSPGKDSPVAAMEPLPRADLLGGLCLSPGGRYLLFNANRPERQ
jgi:dipeptidyl aminopeptidase/acylaminoacyl peptidase